MSQVSEVSFVALKKLTAADVKKYVGQYAEVADGAYKIAVIANKTFGDDKKAELINKVKAMSDKAVQLASNDQLINVLLLVLNSVVKNEEPKFEGILVNSGL